MKIAQKQKQKRRFILSSRGFYTFLQTTAAVPHAGAGGELSLGILKFLEHQVFSTYEKPRTTKYNQLQWCDSRQVCHFRPMTNGRYYNAVTVSSFVEAENIHGNIDPVTSQYRLLPRKRHPRTPTLTQLGRPKRKKTQHLLFPFLSLYIIYSVSKLETTLKKLYSQ